MGRILLVMFAALFVSSVGAARRGKTWISSSKNVGSNRLSQPKIVTIVYRRCYTGTATRVELSVRGEARYRDTFNATLLGIFAWGFRAQVRRADQPRNDWGQSGVNLKWKAHFDSSKFRRNPCANRGRCTNTENGRICQCSDQFTGDLCQKPLVNCYPNPCQFGTCTEIPGDYKCDCQLGRTGKNCTNGYVEGRIDVTFNGEDSFVVSPTYNTCKREPPIKVVLKTANDTWGYVMAEVFAIHRWGFQAKVWRKGGKESAEDPSFIRWRAVFASAYSDHNPCQNRGLCRNTQNGSVCDCPQLSTGPQCETRLSHCSSSPCMNGGTCISTEYFYKCECTIFFAGSRCNEKPQIRDSTTTTPFEVNGPPYGQVVDVAYRRCYSGIATNVNVTVNGSPLYWDRFSGEVLGIYPWGFRTLVRRIDRRNEGWGQSPTVAYVAAFETREFENYPCVNASECVNSAESGRTCVCDPGFTGAFCEKAMSNCYPNPCNTGECVELDGGYKCNCLEGTTGPNCDIVTKFSGTYEVGSNRNPPPYHKTVEVVFRRCRNGTAKKVVVSAKGLKYYPDTFNATVNEVHSWGFRATVDRTDVVNYGWGQKHVDLSWTVIYDSAEMLESPCFNATCTNSVQGQKCHCPHGYGGEFCEARYKFCQSSPCNAGTCVDLPDGYKCICRTGFAGERCTLQSIGDDYSLVYPARAVHSQNLTILYQNCMKEAAAKVEVSFLEDVNEFLEIKLLHGHQGGFVVGLEPLQNSNLNNFALTLRWKAYFDSETMHENPCQNGASCTNSIQGITCHCPERYTGALCEEYIPYCASDPCRNGATCVEERNSFSCQCDERYTGIYCSEEPSVDGNLRLHPYYVFEPPFYLLKNVSYDRCYTGVATRVDTSVTGATRYSDTFNSTVISIYPWGFQVNIVRTDRQDSGWGQFDAELRYSAVFGSVNFGSSPCGDHSESCSNDEENGRKCNCQPGWVGEFCDKELMFCYPNPCNGGVCHEDQTDYRCDCPDGSAGRNCSVGYIAGQHKVDSTAWVSNQQNVTVLYDSCQRKNATNVDLAVIGQVSSFVEAKVKDVHEWGFIASVLRLASVSIDWRVVPVRLQWTAYFDSLHHTINPCVNGTCTNTARGQLCTCDASHTGPNCETALPHCASKPCLNNGACAEEPSGYRCFCLDGFGGDSCEYSIHSAVIPIRPRQLGTLTNENVIYDACYSRQPDRIEGELINLGNYPSDFTASLFSVRRNGFAIQVYRTDNERSRAVEWLHYRYKLFFASPNYTDSPCHNASQCSVVNLDQFLCHCREGYKGELCQERILNCSTDPCKNGGSCSDTESGYRCACKDGYSGNDCSMIRVTGTHHVGRHYGYSSTKDIEVVYDDCHSGLATTVTAAALGNATLPDRFAVNHIRPQPWGFRAELQRSDMDFGWGQPNVFVRYEAWFDETSFKNDVCAPEGRCQNVKYGPQCNCTAGYTGERCEKVDQCFPNPCLNGGQCRNDDGHGFLCQCQPGFIGIKCNIDVSAINAHPAQLSNQSFPDEIV